MSWHKLLTAQDFQELKIQFGNVYVSLRNGAKTVDYNQHKRIFDVLGLSLDIPYRYNRFGPIQLILTTEFLTVNYVYADNAQPDKRHVFLIDTKTRQSRIKRTEA